MLNGVPPGTGAGRPSGLRVHIVSAGGIDGDDRETSPELKRPRKVGADDDDGRGDGDADPPESPGRRRLASLR